MSARATLRFRPFELPHNSAREAGQAYDLIGRNYLAYADGDPGAPFAFGGRHAYGDRRIWGVIDARLTALAEAGHRSVSVIDAGCGPATWLRRVVLRAHDLGFETIVARGFDVSAEQVALAQGLAADLAALPGVTLSIEVGDVTARQREAAGSVDLCLCLNGVLNHLRPNERAAAAAELSRLTGGHLIATVRTVGSTPTIYVDDVSAAAMFRQDNDGDRLEIALKDGRYIGFDSHLFAARELEALFAPELDVVNLCGLDLFHGRFASDPRWNPASLDDDGEFMDRLDLLERSLGSDAHFIDHATHILMVAQPHGMAER